MVVGSVPGGVGDDLTQMVVVVRLVELIFDDHDIPVASSYHLQAQAEVTDRMLRNIEHEVHA
jgi:uncharacterized lipoprotein YbaY